MNQLKADTYTDAKYPIIDWMNGYLTDTDTLEPWKLAQEDAS
jgi:hypothetical protein